MMFLFVTCTLPETNIVPEEGNHLSIFLRFLSPVSTLSHPAPCRAPVQAEHMQSLVRFVLAPSRAGAKKQGENTQYQ